MKRNLLKAIIWDFDGVIVESVSIKADAFQELYLPYGNEIARKVRSYHLSHGGISRQEKFRYFHREYLNIEISEEEITKLSSNFSQLVFSKVVAAPEVPGAVALIQDRDYRHFLITGTPRVEILAILQEKKLLNHFDRVAGAPETKSSAVTALLKDNLIGPKNSVFIGDAREDYLAARNNEIPFLLRDTEENNELFRDYSGPRVKDFTGGKEALEKILFP